MKSTLVLNAGFEPWDIVSARRGIALILSGKANLIEASDDVFRYERGEIPVPYVIQLRKYAKRPMKKIPWSRRWVLLRDDYTCAYCKGYADTIDHVHPQSKGGKNSYENCVASCKKCNNKKGNSSLESMGWVLTKQPKSPNIQVLIHHKIRANKSHAKIWEPYITTGGK